MIDRFAPRFSTGYRPGRSALALALLFSLVGALLAGCGSSSRAISIISPTAPQLTSISVAPPDSSLTVSLTQQFTAVGVYSDGSKSNLSTQVTWSSSAPNVAPITATGVATAVAPGTTTITAALGGVSGSTVLSVGAATLVSISVTPPTPRIAVGTQQQFTATGIYSDYTFHDVTGAVTWGAVNPAVASVSNAGGAKGLGTGVSAGATTVTATLGNITGSTGVTVTTATLVTIGVTPANGKIAAGLTEAITAIGTFSDNSTQNMTAFVTWSSSNPAVATVSSAAGSQEIASGIAQGIATLTATFGAVSGSTGITVTAATLVSITVAPLNASVAKGTHQPFTATGIFSDHSTHDITTAVTWSSSMPTVASVSNAAPFDGVASALTQGATSISATLGGVSGSASLTVSPAVLVSIGVTPANPSIAKGTSQQFTAIGVYSDNSTQDLTTTATWYSATPATATISNAAGSNGVAAAAATGTTLITARFGTVTSPAVTLTVTAATLVSIAIAPPSESVANGTVVQFTATGTYSDNSTQPLTTAVTWSSSAPAVATISNAPNPNGLATTNAVGSTLITAALGTVTSPSVTLTVTPATLVSIAVTPSNASIPKGSTQPFTATGTYSDGSTQVLTASVTWTSSAPGTASISNTAGSNGIATALAIGSAAITATDPATGIASPPVTLTVTAAALVSILVTPAAPVIGIGGSQQFIATGTYTDGSTQTITTAVTWTSGTPATATISNAPGSNGLATGIALGTTAITAAVGTITSNTVTLTVAGALAYAVNFNGATVSQFAIAPDGTLGTLPPPAPAAVAAGADPYSLTTDPSGQYLYVANYNYTQPTLSPGSISQYTIGADGALTPIAAAASVATLNGPNSIVANPKGPYVYVADFDSSAISQYVIGADGSLTPMNPASVSAGAGLNPASIAVTPAGTFAYAVDHNTQGKVIEFSVGPGGALTNIGTVACGKDPNWIVVDPSGHYVYVANSSDNTLSQYTINADGTLTAATPPTVATDNQPWSITIDSTGQHVYVANRGAGTVWQYSATNGILTFHSSITTGGGPTSVAIDPTGHYAYVTERDSANIIAEFSIAPDGSLTPLATTTAGAHPAAIITTR